MHTQKVGVIAAPASSVVDARLHWEMLWYLHITGWFCSRGATIDRGQCSDVFVLQCRRIPSSSVLVREGSTSVLPPPAKAANLE